MRRWLKRMRWGWDRANWCPSCGGRGATGNHRLRACPDCAGRGRLPYPPELRRGDHA